ncbi:hypothetical protein F5B19DRAFT_486362 [Rostrohypoxylon terebratum]|nr:hypothetical protein F5B19DRAFT_486362 [Rostrohypoxylon terebratum]
MATSKGTILITGANGGLGSALVSKIISTPEFAGYYGVYTVRNPSSVPALRYTLSRAPASHHYTVESLDLSRLASVRALAHSINARVAAGEIPPIRASILNAGGNDMGKQSITGDGFDMSFESNYLGHWLLTLMLLQSMNRDTGRIVVTGSSSHNVDHPMHKVTGYFNDEKWKTFFPNDDSVDAIAKGTWATNESATPEIAGGRRYGAAKICIIMMIGELQKRLDADPALKNISVVGVDPGTMNTGIIRNGDLISRMFIFPVIIALLSHLLGLFQTNPPIRTTSKSANDLLAAAFEAGPRLRGAYLNGTEMEGVSREAADVEKRGMVWKHSINYTKLTEQDTALIHWN